MVTMINVIVIHMYNIDYSSSSSSNSSSSMMIIMMMMIITIILMMIRISIEMMKLIILNH